MVLSAAKAFAQIKISAALRRLSGVSIIMRSLMVTSGSSQSGSIVADNGQAYMSGMPLAGSLQVKWD
jgi:outer membrane usher protein FimD/PapC